MTLDVGEMRIGGIAVVWARAKRFDVIYLANRIGLKQ